MKSNHLLELTIPGVLVSESLVPESRLHKLLETLRAQKYGAQPEARLLPYYWNAEHFGLQSVSLFTGATEEQRGRILSILSGFYLQESYFIEKSGFAFNAKMMLLSETTEEKSLFAAFADDEAKHLHAVSRFLPRLPKDESLQNPFLLFLAETIRSGDKYAMTLILQVVLEGFGFAHYSHLAQGCLEPALAGVFKDILKDEAFHHGSGIILAKESMPSDSSRAYVEEALVRFVKLSQLWPHGLLGAMEATLGHLSREQKLAVLSALHYEPATQMRLEKLKSLVTSNATAALVQGLEARGAFRPLSAADCVDRRMD